MSHTEQPQVGPAHFLINVLKDNTFKRIFFNENFILYIKISLKFIPRGPINKILALVQIMAWHQAIIWTNDG